MNAMRAMKKAALTAAFVLLGGSAVAADFQFNGAEYVFGWAGKDGDAAIKEYFVGDETPETWKTLITVTYHPEATKLADVTGPYYKARKSIVAMQPKAHSQKDGDDNDVVLEVFLGAPGRTPHMEYTLARFVETDSGVYSLIYSHKFRFAGKGDQNINVDVAVRNSKRWIRELQEIPVESVEQCFQK